MTMDTNSLSGLIGAIIGAAAAILGGIIGGWVQGRAWFHYEQKRAVEENIGWSGS